MNVLNFRPALVRRSGVENPIRTALARAVLDLGPTQSLFIPEMEVGVKGSSQVHSILHYRFRGMGVKRKVHVRKTVMEKVPGFVIWADHVPPTE